jgi:FdhE protein
LATNLLEALPAEWTLRQQVERLLDSHAWNAQNIEELADSYAENWQQCLDELVLRSGIDHPTVAYVLYTILGPFVERAAESLRHYLSNEVWNKGSCPICGSPPIMAKLTLSEGQRLLGCGLCRTEWVFPRAVCPFCNESNPHKLRQFHANGDRGRRVDVCDTCGTYIKTADERELKRVVVLPVEDLVTVDLDLLAREQGFE